MIDLAADEAKLWRGLSETARQTVRKAAKAGVTVEQADWVTAVDKYYSIHQENYRRTGVTPHPKTYFSGIAQKMAPLGHSVLWLARNAGGEPIAYHNDMHFKEAAWYHTGCSTAAALNCGANYLLFWRAMLGAKITGRRWYDCGEIFPRGSDAKRDGLTLFKTRFGGAPRRFCKAGQDYVTADPSRCSPARRLIRRCDVLRPIWRARCELERDTCRDRADRGSHCRSGVALFALRSRRHAGAWLRCSALQRMRNVLSVGRPRSSAGAQLRTSCARHRGSAPRQSDLVRSGATGGRR